MRWLGALFCLAAFGCISRERPIEPVPQQRLHGPDDSAVSTPDAPGVAQSPSMGSPAGPGPRPADPMPQSELPTHYPLGLVHSPLTVGVAERLRRLVAEHPALSADRFSKIGDSISASPKFMACFSESSLQLPSALESTHRMLRLAAPEPFQRESLSAENGWSAWQPLAGKVAPLAQELGEMRGRFGFVLIGTNDIETSRVTTFAARLVRLVDAMLARGVLPLMSTIPERRDRPLSRLKVPRYNAVIRLVAEARQVPLVDLHHALSALPDEGLSADGIHPSVHRVNGVVRACDFSPSGLQHGFNVRNLLSLEVLDRVRGALAGTLALEPRVERPLDVEGKSLVVPALPLSDVAELGRAPELPEVCAGQTQAPERAFVQSYRFELSEPQSLEVLALSAERAAALPFSLASESDPTSCAAVGRGFKRIQLSRGKYLLSLRGPHGHALSALLRGRPLGS